MNNKDKHFVVCNDSYGGFSLSDQALLLLGAVGAIKTLNERDDPLNPRSYSCYGICRHDKDLIAVVKKLGKEANGSYANLKIAEIEGRFYNIDEYDGLETVTTPHRMEWIEIK